MAEAHCGLSPACQRQVPSSAVQEPEVADTAVWELAVINRTEKSVMDRIGVLHLSSAESIHEEGKELIWRARRGSNSRPNDSKSFALSN